jgi:hypothetical protein
MSEHTPLSNLNSPGTRSSFGSQDSFEFYKLESPTEEQSVLLTLLDRIYSLPQHLSRRHRRGKYYSPLIPTLGRPARHFRRFLLPIPYHATILLSTILLLVLASSVFCPSYTNLPPHYESLRDAVIHSDSPGRGNPYGERVFIAAALYDPSGDLAQGHWGSSIL